MPQTDEQIMAELQSILIEATEIKDRIISILPQSQDSQNNIATFEMLLNGYSVEAKNNADIAKQAALDAKFMSSRLAFCGLRKVSRYWIVREFIRNVTLLFVRWPVKSARQY